MQLVRQCEPKNVLLVHGEAGKMEFLKNKITQEFGKFVVIIVGNFEIEMFVVTVTFGNCYFLMMVMVNGDSCDTTVVQ